MCDQTPQPDSAAPEIIDLEFGISPFRLWVIAIAVPLGLIPALFVAIFALNIQKYLQYSAGVIAVLVCIPLIPVGWMCIVIARRRTRRLVADVLECNDQQVTTDTDGANPFSRITSQTAVWELGQLLVSQGRIGIVIRGVPSHDRFAIEPLTVPFQPVPLVSSDPRFQGLASTQSTSNSGHKPTRVPWRSRRNALVATGILYLGTGCLTLICAGELLGILRTGKVSARGVLNVGILAILVWSMFAPRNYRGSIQWFLVPGGLAFRTPGRTNDWNVHVYRPRDSLMIITNQFDRWWQAFVWDQSSSGWLQMNRQEAELLLRNWLSNMPPPKAEDLSDLA